MQDRLIVKKLVASGKSNTVMIWLRLSYDFTTRVAMSLLLLNQYSVASSSATHY
jgi:hypothetical protein